MRLEKALKMVPFNVDAEDMHRTTESGAIDLELTPRSGNYTILFGRLDDAEQKLDKLLRFYREGLGKAGWDRYRTINVKYAGQVVCTEW